MFWKTWTNSQEIKNESVLHDSTGVVSVVRRMGGKNQSVFLSLYGRKQTILSKQHDNFNFIR